MLFSLNKQNYIYIKHIINYILCNLLNQADMYCPEGRSFGAFGEVPALCTDLHVFFHPPPASTLPSVSSLFSSPAYWLWLALWEGRKHKDTKQTHCWFALHSECRTLHFLLFFSRFFKKEKNK